MASGCRDQRRPLNEKEIAFLNKSTTYEGQYLAALFMQRQQVDLRIAELPEFTKRKDLCRENLKAAYLEFAQENGYRNPEGFAKDYLQAVEEFFKRELGKMLAANPNVPIPAAENIDVTKDKGAGLYYD